MVIWTRALESIVDDVTEDEKYQVLMAQVPKIYRQKLLENECARDIQEPRYAIHGFRGLTPKEIISFVQKKLRFGLYGWMTKRQKDVRLWCISTKKMKKNLSFWRTKLFWRVVKGFVSGDSSTKHPSKTFSAMCFNVSG
jgi:hypothetical protein